MIDGMEATRPVRPAKRRLRVQLAACLLALVAATAQGATWRADCTESSGDCVPYGRWNLSVALGAGVRTNPLVNGQNIPLVVVPQLSYYGRYLFLDNLDLGITLIEADRTNLSLVATPVYDRVFFYRSDLQNLFLGFPGGAGTAPPTLVPPNTAGAVPFPPRARRVTYLAGPEWTFNAHGVVGQLDVLRDITGQNHGEEVRAALGVPLLKAKDSVTATLGLTWKSAAIV